MMLEAVMIVEIEGRQQQWLCAVFCLLWFGGVFEYFVLGDCWSMIL